MGEEMPTLHTEQAVEKVIQEGPTRVVISSAGEAVPPKQAREQHNVKVDVVYIRDDGWSLGAPHEFSHIAEETWKDQWAVFMRRNGEYERNAWYWWHWSESPPCAGDASALARPAEAAEYPECDKMLAVQDKSQALGEFLDWLQEEKGVQLAYYPEGEEATDELVPWRRRTEEILAEFFDIDLKKVEEERRVMLAKLADVPPDVETTDDA